MTSPQHVRDVEQDPATGCRRLAHIVPPANGRPGHAIVLEARVNGAPVTALCGHVLVPSHDPRSFPTCSRCSEIFEASTGSSDGYRDA